MWHDAPEKRSELAQREKKGRERERERERSNTCKRLLIQTHLDNTY